MKIIYTSRFERAFKKLSLETKLLAHRKEKLFRKDTFLGLLKTHKLSGALDGLWAFSIDHGHRIIFEFGPRGIVYFHSIGDHSIYK